MKLVQFYYRLYGSRMVSWSKNSSRSRQLHQFSERKRVCSSKTWQLMFRWYDSDDDSSWQQNETLLRTDETTTATLSTHIQHKATQQQQQAKALKRQLTPNFNSIPIHSRRLVHCMCTILRNGYLIVIHKIMIKQTMMMRNSRNQEGPESPMKQMHMLLFWEFPTAILYLFSILSIILSIQFKHW